MNNFNMNKAVFFIIVSILPLFLAYYVEWHYGAHPCILCMYQRIVFFVSLLLSLVFYCFHHKAWLILIICTFVVNAFIAIYHIGVENHLINTECSVNSVSDDYQVLHQELLGNSLSSCADKTIILGLSIPTWNLIYCVLILCVYFTGAIYKNGKFFKK